MNPSAKRRSVWEVSSPTLGTAQLDNYEAARCVYAQEQLFNGKSAKIRELIEISPDECVVGREDLEKALSCLDTEAAIPIVPMSPREMAEFYALDLKRRMKLAVVILKGWLDET